MFVPVWLLVLSGVLCLALAVWSFLLATGRNPLPFPDPGSRIFTAASAEAKDAFDVILESVPADKKIAVIKAVREVKAGLGLAEAKALVEGAPKPVLEGANKADSDAAKKKLEEAGATVQIK